MKKGKVWNIFAGIFDILLAFILFASVALFFLMPEYVYGLYLPILLRVLGQVAIDPDLLIYIILGLVGVVGILLLIFGIIAIARSGRREEKYYKRSGALIFYMIFEMVLVAAFILWFMSYQEMASLINSSSDLSDFVMIYYATFMAILSLSGLSLLFRFIGMVRVYSGKKRFKAVQNAKIRAQEQAKLQKETAPIPANEVKPVYDVRPLSEIADVVNADVKEVKKAEPKVVREKPAVKVEEKISIEKTIAKTPAVEKKVEKKPVAKKAEPKVAEKKVTSKKSAASTVKKAVPKASAKKAEPKVATKKPATKKVTDKK